MSSSAMQRVFDITELNQLILSHVLPTVNVEAVLLAHSHTRERVFSLPAERRDEQDSPSLDSFTLMSYEPSSAKQFANLCCVQRSWLPIAQRYLYAFLDIKDTATCKLIYRTLKDNTQLAQLVIGIACGFSEAPTDKGKSQIDVLSKVQRTVQFMSITGYAFPSMRAPTKAVNAGQFPNLQYLEVSLWQPTGSARVSGKDHDKLCKNLFKQPGSHTKLRTVLIEGDIMAPAGAVRVTEKGTHFDFDRQSRTSPATPGGLRSFCLNVPFEVAQLVLLAKHSRNLEVLCLDADHCITNKEVLWHVLGAWVKTLRVLRINPKTYNEGCCRYWCTPYGDTHVEFGRRIQEMEQIQDLQLSDVYIDSMDIDSCLWFCKTLRRVDFTISPDKLSHMSLRKCRNSTNVKGMRYRWHEWDWKTGLITNNQPAVDAQKEAEFYQNVKEERGIDKLEDFWWTMPLDENEV